MASLVLDARKHEEVPATYGLDVGLKRLTVEPTLHGAKPGVEVGLEA
jgi:hypothetical protein